MTISDDQRDVPLVSYLLYYLNTTSSGVSQFLRILSKIKDLGSVIRVLGPDGSPFSTQWVSSVFLEMSNDQCN
eukprot:scaffold16800_cov129-Cylindrotheca_fusiformis.AAC.3